MELVAAGVDASLGQSMNGSSRPRGLGVGGGGTARIARGLRAGTRRGWPSPPRVAAASPAAADAGSGAAPATAPPVAIAVGNNSGLVFESAMPRDRCMAAVGRLLVDDLYCDVLSRTDGGHAKLRCTLPNHKKDWPIKIYFESIDSHDANAGAGISGGGWRGKSASPRLARTVVVLSKGRNSDLTPAQLRGFYDQLLIKFRQSSSDAVVSPPPHKVWR